MTIIILIIMIIIHIIIIVIISIIIIIYIVIIIIIIIYIAIMTSSGTQTVVAMFWRLMYCILYLSICRAPLVTSGVNRSEALPVYKAPRKKGFEKAKEDERLSERKVEPTEGESAFQR